MSDPVESVSVEVRGVTLSMEWHGDGLLKLEVKGRNVLDLRGLAGSWQTWNFAEEADLRGIESALLTKGAQHLPRIRNMSDILHGCGLRDQEAREQVFERFLPIMTLYKSWYIQEIGKGKGQRKEAEG